MHLIRKLERSVHSALVFVTGAITVAIACVLLLQVVSRMIFKYPFAWPEELAGFLFTWLIFLGASVAYRSGSMIGIDWLVQMLPTRARAVINTLTSLLMIMLLMFLVWKGVETTLKSANSQTTVLRFSWAWVYAAFPVGFSFLLASITLDFLANPKSANTGILEDESGR
ncbi:TRAP transporter small permease [Silicimonas algicola]|uniref:TRAP transporter small permease protein n=1 Tax=Silicimonas algicola TaxID=1826607 RepID=A0A316G9M8_9RHOB|nr:TRAP transporter small permease [Silicimonas algicola]AZQ67956.1 TRAP transporter small permease [Silicimonas algicola]PWK57604.1 TRAP-type C4-dicarboxylate transport system permease small subunit [Silicimonas algicola]